MCMHVCMSVLSLIRRERLSKDGVTWGGGSVCVWGGGGGSKTNPARWTLQFACLDKVECHPGGSSHSRSV